MAELAVEGLVCGYGGAPVLRGVSVRVESGEVVALLGRNGAGKTTLLRAVTGLLRPVQGRIRMDGVELHRLPPHELPRLGVGYVPQGRRLFPELTVEENLRLALRLRKDTSGTLEQVVQLFPVIRERWRRPAKTLSGGEQQMVAIARALCLRPHFLLLDEPFEGLMPAAIQTLLHLLPELTREGVGILVAEQRIEAALEVADRVVILAHGEVRHTQTTSALRENPEPLVRFLGVRR